MGGFLDRVGWSVIKERPFVKYIMQTQQIRGSPLKITQYQYKQPQDPKSQYHRNPIKIVIDKIAENGAVQQQVIEDKNESPIIKSSRKFTPRKSK